MASKLGCVSILLASCAGCCCFRIPTFGLGPELPEEELRAKIEASPDFVQRQCWGDEWCKAIEDFDMDVVPVSWNPFTGTWVALVGVEARCTPPTAEEAVKDFVTCSAVVAAVATPVAGVLVIEHVTDETLLGLDSPGPSSGGGVPDVPDWDWD